jgi:tRNA-(ms[2]io[6]A)-hydroxylase
MKKRGWHLGKARKDEYVIQLAKLEEKGGSREKQLAEKLLLCAIIEARSCERFKILCEQLEDPELKKFYYEFMVSEAGHYTRFLALAKRYYPEAAVKKRWSEILESEASIIRNLEIRGDRVH